MKIRKIIHVDMDAFYASVEQRDNRSLRGKPVIVGGTVIARGVVAACSYEARKFGIHSAMATATALKLCPGCILVPPDFKKYEEASSQINEIFHEYTQLVEPLSLDEAYLDVTDNFMDIPSATQIAREIKSKIMEKTNLSASAGVSYCKFLAKIASGYKKPDGLTIVKPDDAPAFIAKLPIGSFYGVGKVTEKYMHSLNIKTGLDLRNKSLSFLKEHFGSSAQWFYDLARGIDDSPVEPNRERKSIGRETTLAQDTTDMNEINEILEELCFDVEKDMTEADKKGSTITLKIKYHDFTRITRSVTINKKIMAGATIFKNIRELLLKTEAGKKKIRLLGVSMHGFDDKPGAQQLKLPV
jgi:DNA polymerase IV